MRRYKKKIILIHFRVKNTLKNNRNHTLKHATRSATNSEFCLFSLLFSFSLMARKSSKIRMKGKTCFDSTVVYRTPLPPVPATKISEPLPPVPATVSAGCAVRQTVSAVQETSN